MKLGRKTTVWFLILAFVNLAINPEFVIAGPSTIGTLDLDGAGPSHKSVALAVAGVIVLGSIITLGLVYLAKKHRSSPTEQSQDQKQEAPQSLHFQQPDEQLTAQLGQIALLRW
jgi:hypothetical protein